MSTRPVIAVSACRRIIDPHPFHMVGEKYLNALIASAGALPVMVPALGPTVLDDYLDHVHGLFLTGSYSNVEPHRYGGAAPREGTLQDPERDGTTLPLIEAAISRALPMLAVCRGFQEVNVALGGTLHQHLQEVAGFSDHREDPGAPLDQQYGPAHSVTLEGGGYLASLLQTDRITVNSLHAQGVAELAPGLSIEARADDGLIEAFRIERHPGFALGVQWHPEWRSTDNEVSTAIFDAFGAACRDYANQAAAPVVAPRRANP